MAPSSMFDMFHMFQFKSLFSRSANYCRYFTELNAASSQHFTIPTYTTTTSGWRVEYEYSTSLGPPATLQVLFGATEATNWIGVNTSGQVYGNYGTSQTYTGTTNVCDGKLHSISVEYVGTEIVVTVDGVEEYRAVHTGAASYSFDISAIGYRPVSTPYDTDGIAANVKMYDESGILERYYKINENWAASTSLLDHSGNAQHGTAVNITSADAEKYCFNRNDNQWENQFWPNLISYSNELDQWSAFNSPVVTANTDNDPWGLLTADTAEDNSATGSYVFNGMPSFTPATDYYVTAYVKKDAIPRATRFIKFQIECLGGTDTYSGCYLDTATGEGHKFAAVTDITDLSVTSDSDYWLYAFKFNDSNANNTFNIRVFPASGAGNNWAESGAAVGSVVLGGVQIALAGNTPFKKTAAIPGKRIQVA